MPGFLWYMATLLIPLSLGATAELIQRKVLSRRFQWTKALTRSLASVPIAIGPFHRATSVFPYIGSPRPTHWVAKELLFYRLSVGFGYLAVRIKKGCASQLRLEHWEGAEKS